MKVLSLLVLLVIIAALIISISNASAAQIRVKSPYDNALERRMKHSEDITLEDVENMSLKDLREHLSWRGELCADCNMLPEKMKENLLRHLKQKTEVSTKKYSETSARLRNFRRYKTPNDVVKTNGLPHEDDPSHPSHPQYDHFSPEAKLKRMEARRRKHEDPNDPLRSLKDVMGSHGFDVNSHPVTTKHHAGHKELHDFVTHHKKRAREYDEGRNPAYLRAQEQVYKEKQAEKEMRERSEKQAGDL